MNWYRQKKCQHCSRKYNARRSDQKFCSSTCRLRHFRRKKRLKKARYLLETLSGDRLAQLQALEEHVPGARDLVAGIVAVHDLDAGCAAMALASHVAGVELVGEAPADWPTDR